MGVKRVDLGAIGWDFGPKMMKQLRQKGLQTIFGPWALKKMVGHVAINLSTYARSWLPIGEAWGMLLKGFIQEALQPDQEFLEDLMDKLQQHFYFACGYNPDPTAQPKLEDTTSDLVYTYALCNCMYCCTFCTMISKATLSTSNDLIWF